MKWFLIAAACILLPCSTLAQTDSLTASSHPNSLRGGAWALQFDVNGQVFSVESFTGGVSLKRQFSPKWALRFGVGFDASDSSSDETDSEFGRDTNSYGASIETVYQRYLNPGGVVNAYWSLGPLVSARRSTMDNSSPTTGQELKDVRWSAGAIASFGVEWFFASQFSLHSEFTGSVSYFEETRERTVTQAGEVVDYEKFENDGWSIGTSDNVRLGLSVYF